MTFKPFGGNTVECRACHQQVSTDAIECPHCGEELQSLKLFGGNTVECRACHKQVSSDATECPHCGEELKSFKLFGGNTVECRTCHEQISSDATECPYCGEELKSFKLFGGNTVECRACHEQVSTDAAECPHCGEELQSFKLFGGNTIECRACHEQVSTNATECPYCGEDLTNSFFKSSAPRHSSRTSTNQRELRTRNTDEETDSSGWIIKWVVYLALFIGAIWLAFAVVLPLAIINTAIIGLILGFTFRDNKSYLFILSFLGAIFIVADYSNGWLTRTLVQNVSFFAGIIPFLLYLNITAGLIASYFLVRDLIDAKRPPLSDSGEFSKRNIIIMASLLVIGGLTVWFQKPLERITYPESSPITTNANTNVISNSNQADPVKVAVTTIPERTDSLADSAKITTNDSTHAATIAGNDVTGQIYGIYPQSSTRLLFPSELIQMDKFSLKIMRNEVFARYGYIFKTAEMKNYFSTQDWYKPLYDDVTNKLSKIEKENIELIQRYESDQSAQKNFPKIGDISNDLPNDSRKIEIAGETYFLSEDGYYYQRTTDTNGNRAYKVVGTPSNKPNAGN